jgi:hypothetical protein
MREMLLPVFSYGNPLSRKSVITLDRGVPKGTIKLAARIFDMRGFSLVLSGGCFARR